MSQLSEVTQRLRETLLTGAFEPGEKVAEVAVAERLGVSRTPARLAMAALEQEGLLVRTPHRGVTVREFTLQEVTDAILVRGQLEGMAARLAAERGIEPATAERMDAILAEAEGILRQPDFGLADRTRWIELNREFHDCVLTAADNQPLSDTIDQISRVPLAAANAIVFNRLDLGKGHNQIASAHDDHRRVLQAIRERQGARAEAIMREHAHRSAENKRENFREIKTNSARALPGVTLVR